MDTQPKLKFDEDIKNRDFAASALDTLNIPAQQRAIVRTIFHELWPQSQTASLPDKAISRDILLQGAQMGKTMFATHIAELLKRGLIVRDAIGKIGTFRIDWNVVYEIRTTEPVRKKADRSGQLFPDEPNRSGPDDSGPDRTGPDHPNRSGEKANRFGDETDRSGPVRPQDCLTGNDAIVFAIEELREAVQQLISLFAGQPDRTGSHQSGPVRSGPVPINSINLNSIESNKSNSIEFGRDEKADRTGPDRSGETGGTAQADFRDFKWPKSIFKKMNAKTLKDPAFVNDCFAHVVSVGRFPPGETGKIQFLALLMESASIESTKPGGVLTNKIRDGSMAVPEWIEKAKISIGKLRTTLANVRDSPELASSAT